MLNFLTNFFNKKIEIQMKTQEENPLQLTIFATGVHLETVEVEINGTKQ